MEVKETLKKLLKSEHRTQKNKIPTEDIFTFSHLFLLYDYRYYFEIISNIRAFVL